MPLTDPAWVAQAALAREVGETFGRLYERPFRDAKALLRQTMTAIQKAHDLLDTQWRRLGQSPEVGRGLLAQRRGHPRYGDGPVLFYSRKVSVEEAQRALEAGAIDVIRKGFPVPGPEARQWVLSRLARALALHGSPIAAKARALGLNVNTTLLPEERPV